jgi:Tetratricopeptide repeat
MENFKLLFQIYFRPASAMSEILDKGNWIFAAALVLLVSAAFFFTIDAKLQTVYRIPQFFEFYQPDYGESEINEAAAEAAYKKAENAYQTAMNERQKVPIVGDYFHKFFSFEPGAFFQILLSLTIFYVPAAILLMCIFGGIGNFGVVLQRDYGALSICSLMAWAAAHLPFAVAGILLYSSAVSPEIYFALWIASSILFGILMIFALRTVFGANYMTAVLVVCVAWLAFSLGMYVFRFVSPWLFSPFLLFYGYMYFGGAVSGGINGFGNAFRRKQNFKRYLHSATVNPRDADAHVQLALIYLQRRQQEKALEHLNKAVEIDANEIDANYELGKIARAKGELQTALDHFTIVAAQNDKHSLSEIWREVGATYLDAKMYKEAREALEKYVTRRSSDAEGLYYLGKVLQMQNESEKARETFEQSIEAAKTSPDYRRRELRQWIKLAQKEI